MVREVSGRRLGAAGRGSLSALDVSSNGSKNGARRFAAGSRRRTATLATVLGLLLAVAPMATVSPAGASSASAATTTSVPAKTKVPSFAPGPCPKTPEPIPALTTAHCGYLTVAENHSKPNGPTIKMAVAVIPATSPNPSPVPVLYLHGGPGGDVFTAALPDLINAGVNQDHELVVMAQRGTYFSQPNLICPQSHAAMAQSTGMVYDSPATGKLYAQAAAACRKQLTSEGINVADYNTRQSAADYADLQKALGIKQWDVFGHSYGTDLALTYLRLYPKGINSVILDGVVPPSQINPKYFWQSKQAIDAMFQACTKQPACNAAYPHLYQTFINEVRKLEAHPVTTSVTLPDGSQTKVVLDGGTLLQWVVAATHTPTVLPEQLTQLANGNPQPIATTWAAAKQNHADAVGATAWGQFYSIVCSEWVPFSTAAQDVKAGKRAFPQFPSSVLAQAPQLPFIRQICKAWNVPKAPASTRVNTRSKVPTLILNGSFDSQTAPSWGAYVAKYLPNSTNLVFPGLAHAVYADSACGDSVIRSFLNNPKDPDTTCVASVKPKPFQIGPQSG